MWQLRQKLDFGEFPSELGDEIVPPDDLAGEVSGRVHAPLASRRLLASGRPAVLVAVEAC